MDQQTAKTVIVIGLTIVLIGLIWYFWGNKLHFLGRLPGDIRIERENFRFYFPITTLILLSLLLTVVLNLIKKFL